MSAPTAANTAPVFTHPQLGHTGMTQVDFGKSQDTAIDVALQPDGRIVVVGSYSGLALDTGLLRLNADGSPDTGFGSQGKTVVHVPDRSTESFGVALQADGALVVVGAFGGNLHGNGYVKDLGVMRFDDQGRLDPSFSADGMASVDLGSDGDEGRSVALQADGKIVVAGFTLGPLIPGIIANGAFSVARLTADGRLDAGFGREGLVSIDFGSRPDAAYDLVIQGDGKMVVAGYSTNDSNTASSFSLVRLEADGRPDAGFGNGGRASVGLDGGWNLAHGVTLQPDGKVLVAGYINDDFGLIRLDAQGALDASFGDGGKAVFDIGLQSDDGARRVLVQPDGKIVVAGASDGRLVLIRVDAHGALDPGFSSDGKLSIDVGNAPGWWNSCSVALQPDGKLVLAGGDDAFNVIRVDTDGWLDTSFGEVADGTAPPPPSTLGGKVHYTEGAAAVVLDADVAVFDAELGALDGGVGRYAGATLRLSRAGGASAQDQFSATGHLAFSGGHAVLDGIDVGTVRNAGGALRIAFNDEATQQRVNDVLRGIGYANASEAPSGSVALNWRFQDGSGPDARSVTERSTVLLHNVNDAPTGGVTISGQALVGQRLQAESTLADADGLGTLGWQWLRGGKPIPGATGATYTLTDADVGQALRVKASYKDGGHTAECVLSAPSALVSYAPDQQSGDAGGLPVADVLHGGQGDSTLAGRGGSDKLYGDLGRDTLSGGTGNDLLDGGAGADALDGGKGDDVLIGGAGPDRLTGGEGRDVFRFTALGDLGPDGACDRILDFTPGQDRIDLSAIDADAATEGDQAFSVVSSGWGDAPGQLRYADGIVFINTDTDAAAEYRIELVGRVLAALSAADFVL